MGNRWLWILGVVVLLLCTAAGLRSCLHDSDDAASAPVAGSPAQPKAATSTAAAEAAAAQRALVARRNEAMASAVSTLHAYLAALGGDDRAKADAYWAGGKPPAHTGEADLRTMKGLRALRTENGTPSPLDSEPVPNALEIPVELRASFRGEPMRRYRGWYRLRRAVAGSGWEITSASIDVLPQQR
jgi:hypothetical protein